MDADLTRSLMADIERDLAELDGPPSGDRLQRVSALRASWLRLVQHLALGPAPLVRSCPACGGTIMRAATRCVHCWTKSLPPIEPAAEKVAD